MGNIIYLGTAAPSPTAKAFAQRIDPLAIQSERLQTLISNLGGCLKNLASAVDRLSDPAVKAQLRLQIQNLRCHLLLASLELAKLARLSATEAGALATRRISTMPAISPSRSVINEATTKIPGYSPVSTASD